MKLVIKSAGRTWQYLSRRDAASISIGQRPGNDIVLEDAKVSNLHVRLDRFLSDWTFTDQMSDAGTLLNGNPESTGNLQQGDVLTIGDSTITVEDLDAEESAAKSSQAAPRQASTRVQPAPPPSPAPRQSPPRPAPQHQPQPSWQPPPVSQAGARRGAAVVLALLVMIAAGAAAFFFMIPARQPSPPTVTQESPPADTPPASAADVASATPDPEPPPRSDRLTRDQETDYRERMRALLDDTSTPAEQRLATLERLAEEVAQYKGHMLEHEANRIKHRLGVELSRQMQARYGSDNGTIYEMKKEHRYYEAHAMLEALAEYCNATPYHQEWAKRHDFWRYIDREREQLPHASERWLGEQLSAADEALTRDDFAAAADAIELATAHALLNEDTRDDLRKESAAHREAATAQEAGLRAGPRKPFDPKADALPRAPISKLLPQGQFSSLRSETRLRQRLERLVRGEGYQPLRVMHHERTATLERYDGGRMHLRVERPLAGDGAYTYLVSQPLHQLPAGTRASCYEQMPDLTQNERVGILMLCYDAGRIEHAARVALGLWKAHPEVKPDLDQLMATKLRVDVPEGGFIERDGMLVVPE